MARRISLSQLQNQLRNIQRDIERQRRQAIDRYNQGVRRVNQAIDTYNREARAHNARVNQAINTYNREADAHNARVRANRQRLQSALARLASQPRTTRYVTFRTSVESVSSAFVRFEQRLQAEPDARYDQFLDLSEREAANSVGVMNALLGGEPLAEEQAQGPEDTELIAALGSISPDLRDRWRGAVFALNPGNPDAARHFCTSAREIMTHILETKAPDAHVIAALPNCDRTDRGNPTRRSRIRFFLHRKGLLEDTLEDFIERDLQNIVDLFDTFNAGTHGPAGRFQFAQLAVIRKRVEDGVFFLSRLLN